MVWVQRRAAASRFDRPLTPQHFTHHAADSSVHVYMPTKLRRAGSHTTGTYADPANNMRQVCYSQMDGDTDGAPTAACCCSLLTVCAMCNGRSWAAGGRSRVEGRRTAGGNRGRSPC